MSAHRSSPWQRVTAWFRRHTNPPVWFGSAAVVIVFVSLAALFPAQSQRVSQQIQASIVDTLGWYYILAASVMLGFVIWLLFSRYGQVRLGDKDSRPEFGYLAWVSMLLAAGMGIGIVFFGVAEPVTHYANPPLGEGSSDQSLQDAMRFTFFHWGLHPWAIYTCLALPLAYFHFRRGLPLAPRSLLYPLIGEKIHGWIGHAVDILCTAGTLFGVATSLGLGSMQINAGLNHLFGLSVSPSMQIMLIASITGIATISVVTGVKGGIRVLSLTNVGLAMLILVFVLITGPTVYVLDLFVSSLGYYLQKLPETSFYVEPGQAGGWQANWTLFYWSWWISWSPFVGIFVARISKGRTLREFVMAALLVPTLIGFFWFSVVGGTGLHTEIMGTGGILEAAQDEAKGSSLYRVLETLPYSEITVVLGVLLVFFFFVTSSDSGSFVDDMVTSGGNPNPPKALRIFWAISEGAVAAALLLAGGLQSLRTASLTTGLPMSVLLLTACVGLYRALRQERPDLSR